VGLHTGHTHCGDYPAFRPSIFFSRTSAPSALSAVSFFFSALSALSAVSFFFSGSGGT
jgi:hypothetical protein